MSGSAFAKMVDDAVREELLSMGYDHARLVGGIDEPRGHDGCVVRMRGKIDDIEIVPKGEEPTRGEIAAQVRRKLEIALRNVRRD